jgi:hypothetical protein
MLRPLQQPRQLGDIGGDPPRLESCCTGARIDLVTAGLVGGDQFSVLRNYLLVGHDPFLGDVFLVNLDLVAALKVAKRVFRTGFVLVKPPNLKI